MNHITVKPFHVIIAGTRTFNNYPLLTQWCDHLLQFYDSSQVVIISGGARGADKLGERYAKDRGMGLIVKPALWDRYGKSAGYIRNKQMAEIADALILFWDGKSRGSMHMRDLAVENNIKYIQEIKY
ncbi:DUF2493 domain-containing protein [Bacillus velezensis]|nr:DUF2493 domain-containing protein [Bacillus velezensis]